MNISCYSLFATAVFHRPDADPVLCLAVVFSLEVFEAESADFGNGGRYEAISRS